MTASQAPSGVRMVIDSHDHKPRPYCDSIGKLFALAMRTNRYLAPTKEEDLIWRATGQAQIDQVDARRRVAAVILSSPAVTENPKRMPA